MHWTRLAQPWTNIKPERLPALLPEAGSVLSGVLKTILLVGAAWIGLFPLEAAAQTLAPPARSLFRPRGVQTQIEATVIVEKSATDGEQASAGESSATDKKGSLRPVTTPLQLKSPPSAYESTAVLRPRLSEASGRIVPTSSTDLPSVLQFAPSKPSGSPIMTQESPTSEAAAPPTTMVSPAPETPTLVAARNPPAVETTVAAAPPTVAPTKNQEPAKGKDSPKREPSNADDAPLQPIPDPGPGTGPNAGPVEIDAASFNGVTPGVSDLAAVRKAWGEPKGTKEQGGGLLHLYKVEPFDRVEVLFFNQKAASIVIRLEKSFPADAVAGQLELTRIRPVLISNELGEILGQSYPERGVLFAFESSPTPAKATMKVTQIILEPITAEPFLLRAETQLSSAPESSLRDLDHAVKLAPTNARAQWLRARLLSSMGDPVRAAAAADEAVRLDPKDAQYRVTRAQIFGQLGRFAEAMRDAEKSAATAGDRLHVKARAQCLQGDLMSSGPKPDYRQAIQYHMQAIKTAQGLVSDTHPAIRLPAKEVLIDAHLGAAHDIAWGEWNQKQTAVPVWLKKAAAFADEMIQNDHGTNEHRFRVATRALAACVGAQGKLDPGEWADLAIKNGEEMASAAGQPGYKKQVQGELGIALYDAVQVYQMRGEREQAVRYGRQAVKYLEPQSTEGSIASIYLLGRLYFRLGSTYAVGDKKDHAAAIAWFDRASPVLKQAAPQVAPQELGRLGETFVSMGVSYWEAGQHEAAVRLTQDGVGLMEQAVKVGMLPASTLDIPYTNLATMHRHLGKDDQAEKYLEKAAARRGNSTVRR